MDNAIVLCPRCHGEAGHYNPRHPLGNKYSPDELKMHRDAWWELCKKNPITAFPDNQKQPSSKNVTKSSKMIIVGNGNVQAGGNLVINTTKAPSIKTLPPPGSIGSNPFLKETIQNKFNRLGDERKKRFGKSAYPAMYKTFKRDFKIKNGPWTTIWIWSEACAQAIIDYLNEKYDNTIKGRIEKASKRPEHIGPRPQLLKMEKELLENLGWKYKGIEHCEFLLSHFGVTSHKELDHLQQWQLVKTLEMMVASIE